MSTTNCRERLQPNGRSLRCPCIGESVERVHIQSHVAPIWHGRSGCCFTVSPPLLQQQQAALFHSMTTVVDLGTSTPLMLLYTNRDELRHHAVAQSVHDHALAFVPFSDGTPVEEIEALFRRLGKIGMGLHAVLQKNPSTGKLFGEVDAAWCCLRLSQFTCSARATMLSSAGALKCCGSTTIQHNSDGTQVHLPLCRIHQQPQHAVKHGSGQPGELQQDKHTGAGCARCAGTWR